MRSVLSKHNKNKNIQLLKKYFYVLKVVPIIIDFSEYNRLSKVSQKRTCAVYSSLKSIHFFSDFLSFFIVFFTSFLNIMYVQLKI